MQIILLLDHLSVTLRQAHQNQTMLVEERIPKILLVMTVVFEIDFGIFGSNV